MSNKVLTAPHVPDPSVFGLWVSGEPRKGKSKTPPEGGVWCSDLLKIRLQPFTLKLFRDESGNVLFLRAHPFEV